MREYERRTSIVDVLLEREGVESTVKCTFTLSREVESDGESFESESDDLEQDSEICTEKGGKPGWNSLFYVVTNRRLKYE